MEKKIKAINLLIDRLESTNTIISSETKTNYNKDSLKFPVVNIGKYNYLFCEKNTFPIPYAKKTYNNIISNKTITFDYSNLHKHYMKHKDESDIPYVDRIKNFLEDFKNSPRWYTLCKDKSRFSNKYYISNHKEVLIFSVSKTIKFVSFYKKYKKNNERHLDYYKDLLENIRF